VKYSDDKLDRIRKYCEIDYVNLKYLEMFLHRSIETFLKIMKNMEW